MAVVLLSVCLVCLVSSLIRCLLRLLRLLCLLRPLRLLRQQAWLVLGVPADDGLGSGNPGVWCVWGW